jgi:hypothetical protein
MGPGCCSVGQGQASDINDQNAQNNNSGRTHCCFRSQPFDQRDSEYETGQEQQGMLCHLRLPLPASATPDNNIQECRMPYALSARCLLGVKNNPDMRRINAIGCSALTLTAAGPAACPLLPPARWG